MNPAGVPRVLSIAGTDPTGGAGIHADLKSIAALGGYGMAVVTALVAQNTRGVSAVHTPPVEFLTAQLRAVSDDVEIDAVKIGMLQSVSIVDAVAEWLDAVRPPIVVLDPVMVATSGDRLLDAEAEDAVRELCRRADLVTPNLAELAVLTAQPQARTWADAQVQARALARHCETAVLLKGGHLDGEDCPDAVVTVGGVVTVEGERVDTRNTHGTGCSLSSALATLRARGLGWDEALQRAKEWITGALRAADALEVGQGNGPIDHFHEHRPHVRAWSTEVWDSHRGLRTEIDELAFVRALRDGSLEEPVFHWYLAQDALYLRDYSRVLARASALAPTRDEQVFWAAGATGALVEEERLHRVRIGDDLPDAAPATTAYVDHLLAVAGNGSYGELVAAILPCYWLYTDIGARVRGTYDDAHPYADWLDAYGDEAFERSSDEARRIADAAARRAGADERQRMSTAFSRALRAEHDFFAAPIAQRNASLVSALAQ